MSEAGMRRVAAPRVVFDLAQLELGKKIGEGGQGTVYAVRHTTIGGAGGRAAVVYKQYREEQLAALDGEALQSLVAMVNHLTDADARWLAAHAAWPSAVVTREGAPVGFLMRSVPSMYTFSFPGLSPRTPARTKLTAFEFLLNGDDYTRRIGLGLGDEQRTALLASVASVLAGLHRLGVAVGDLSPKNLLFARQPARDCFLIDCDAFRLHGASVLPQAETPDWALPAGEEKGTTAGDVYKFALLVVRLLARSQTATDVADLRNADRHLLRLLRRSLSPVPRNRPVAGQWEEQLRALTKERPRAAPVPAAAPAPARPPRPTPSPTPSPTRTPTRTPTPSPPARRSYARYDPYATAAYVLGARPHSRWGRLWYDRELAVRAGRRRRGSPRDIARLVGGLALLIPAVFVIGLLKALSMPFRSVGDGGCLGPAMAVLLAFGSLVGMIAFVGWLESH